MIYIPICMYTCTHKSLVYSYTYTQGFRFVCWRTFLLRAAREGDEERWDRYFFSLRERKKKMQPKKGNILTFVWKKKMKKKEMIIESWISGYGLGMGWGSFEYRYSENCKFYAVSLVQYIHTYIYIFAKYLSFTSFRWLSNYSTIKIRWKFSKMWRFLRSLPNHRTIYSENLKFLDVTVKCFF